MTNKLIEHLIKHDHDEFITYFKRLLKYITYTDNIFRILKMQIYYFHYDWRVRIISFINFFFTLLINIK